MQVHMTNFISGHLERHIRPLNWPRLLRHNLRSFSNQSPFQNYRYFYSCSGSVWYCYDGCYSLYD
jgi:hypothetical protein